MGLSVIDAVTLLPKLLLAIPHITWSTLRRVLAIWQRKTTPSFIFHVAFYRFALGTLSARQIQFLTPSTLNVYKAWVHKTRSIAARKNDTFILERVSEDIEGLPDGASSLMWIGDRKKAQKVLLYFHGGGYMSPMLSGHAQFCLESCVRASDVEVAIAMLQYTLAPESKYPGQLRQATAGLQHILNAGFHPSDIIIGGDSAGGNLTVQLLSHLLHPHPSIPKLALPTPLAGAVTISPWLTNNVHTHSFTQNAHTDMLTSATMLKADRNAFDPSAALEKPKSQGWAYPIDVDGSWFHGLEGVVKELYVTAGEQEVLRDQGIAFAEVVRRRCPGVGVRLEMPGEAHDFILLEGENRVVGDATRRMRSWVASVVEV